MDSNISPGYGAVVHLSLHMCLPLILPINQCLQELIFSSPEFLKVFFLCKNKSAVSSNLHKQMCKKSTKIIKKSSRKFFSYCFNFAFDNQKLCVEWVKFCGNMCASWLWEALTQSSFLNPFSMYCTVGESRLWQILTN